MTHSRAPFHDDIAGGPEGGAAHWVRADDGARIRMALWPGGDRGTVLILPGRAEHIEKYGPAAAVFAKAGYAAAAVDWRGQGLSDRLTGDHLVSHVGAFSDYQRDLTAAMDFLNLVGAPEPRHFIAHSMGGAIGLRALARGVPAARAVFSAPMWGIRLRPATRAAAWTLCAGAETLRLDYLRAIGQDGRRPYVEATAFPDNLLTGDETNYQWMRDQLARRPDLGVAGPTWRWISEALRECRALRRLPPPDAPSLIIAGDRDKVVDTEAARRRSREWPGAEFLELAPCAHDPMMEIPEIRDRAFGAILRHLDAHR